MTERRIMARMAKRSQNQIPGSYEIWQQYAGEKPDCILSLHNRRDVENILDLFMRVEKSHHFKTQKVDGGFFSYKRNGKDRVPEVHYWYEEVMPDQHLKIDAEITDWLAVAAATAAAEVREQERAAADDFRRDAG